MADKLPDLPESASKPKPAKPAEKVAATVTETSKAALETAAPPAPEPAPTLAAAPPPIPEPAAAIEAVAAAAEPVMKAAEAVVRQATAFPLEAASFDPKDVTGAVQRSLDLFKEMGAASQKNLEAISRSFSVASQGAQTLGSQAYDFSRQAYERQFSTVKSLASVRTVDEALDIQSRYASAAIENAFEQMMLWTDTVASTAEEAFKPIGERLSAAAERLPTAPPS